LLPVAGKSGPVPAFFDPAFSIEKKRHGAATEPPVKNDIRHREAGLSATAMLWAGALAMCAKRGGLVHWQAHQTGRYYE
jgi:hypothetical protein